MTEKQLEAKLRDKIKQLGGLALKLVCPSFTGVPDRMILLPKGRIWFVEMKARGKIPTPRQEAVHTILRKLGFDVWVIDSNEALSQFLFAVEVC